MYQNMMGSPGAPFGEQQVNDMGQQPMPAPRPMPMPNYRGYGFNPQPGGMPQPNPNYGGDTDMGMSDYMRRMAMDPEGERARKAALRASLGGGMPQPNPNYGQMPAPAPRPMPMPYPVDFSRLLGGGMSQYPGFGGAVQPGGMDYLRGQFGGGFNPQPDDGRVDNPDMQNPFRTFNNGNPFYNAKGNLRMRYRPGGQMGDEFAYRAQLAQGVQPTGY